MCSVAVTTETNNDEDDNDVRIRKYQPSSSRDLPSVQKLFADGMRFQNAGEWYIQQSLASDLSSIEKIYFVGRGTFLVMERKSDHKIIGIIGLQDLSTTTTTPTTNSSSDGNNNTTTGNSDGNDNNMCELRRMSIDSNERRKGYGKQLIEYFIAYGKKQNYKGIILTTGSWVTSVHQFYSSLGFTNMGNVEYQNSGIMLTNFQMIF